MALLNPHDLIALGWKGRPQGIGDPMMIAWFVTILRDNGVNAYFIERPRLGRLSPIDPAITLRDKSSKYNVYWKADAHDQTPIHLQYIRHFEQYYGPLKVDWEKRNHVPVKYYEISKIPAVDVVLNTKTGNFTMYKLWPYFPELKILLRKAKISFIDLDKDWKETYGIRCLNYIRKAKLYIGLDSGMSHYVSRFANGKALIINGGYVTFKFWSHPYDFEVIQVEDLPCGHCLLNKYQGKVNNRFCEYDQRCMREISPEQVFNRIEERLNGIS